jgi:isopentenyl-diphosphate delta-isomerase
MKKIAEEVVLVDKNDNVLGYKDKLEAHKNPVQLHRAISAIIFDPQNTKVLIQKRSAFKPTWPLFWSGTVCTHPRRGESYLASTKRRLMEELGINSDVMEKFKFIYKAKYNKTYGEYELDRVFTGNYSGEIKPDPKEVSDHKWIEISALKRDFKNNPSSYTPWFIKIVKKLKI